MARKSWKWNGTHQRPGKLRQKKSFIKRRNNVGRSIDLGIEHLEPRWVLASPGSLDPTFGTTGVVAGQFGISADVQFTAVAVQGDGKIVAAGSIITPGDPKPDMVVARFNSNGSLDTTFGDDDGIGGYTRFDVDNFPADAFDVAIDTSGNIFVAGRGTATGSPKTGFVLAKLGSDGELASGFGTGGKAFTLFTTGTDAEAHSLTLQSNGKIVLAGTEIKTSPSSTGYDFAVARYNADGTLDTTFGTLGKVITDFNGKDDVGLDVELETVGAFQKIVVVGSATRSTGGSQDFALARYNPNGSLDTATDGIDVAAFGVTGKVITVAGVGNFSQIAAASVDSLGRIVVAGTTGISGSSTDTVIGRYTAAGTLDTAFSPSPALGPAGTLRIDFSVVDSTSSLVVQPDGQYVVGAVTRNAAATGNASFNYALARVNSLNGSLDTSFGTAGKVTVPAFPDGPGTNPGEPDLINLADMALQQDGKLIAVGYQDLETTDADYLMARYITGLTSISGPATISEGAPYTLTTTSGDATAWTITWGDSSPPQLVLGNPGNITHTYADGPNNYTISATVTTSTGTTAVNNTVAVSVLNVPPTLAISGAANTNEAASYTLNLSSSDPGPDTISQWTITWGDSSPAQVVAGNPTSVTHVYADGDASRTITATATDEDGTYPAGNAVVVTVHNVDPTLTISGASDVNEGSTYTLGLSSFDPGADTISQWTIFWGDGGPAQVVSGNPTSVTHVYADGDVSATITATATDEDGPHAAGNSVLVSVHNVAPALAISGATSVNEGSVYTLGLSSMDPGTDTISQWTINWGDTTQVVTGNPTSATHTYADGAATYTISATAKDEDGTYTAGNTVSVSVNNVAPTLTISGAANVNEGSSYTLSLFASDPGADTISQWSINWGDVAQIVSGNPTSVSHTYADGDANYTISATATDEDGTFAAGNTVAVAVHNVAPTITVDTGSVTVNEGQTATNSGTFGDVPADTVTLMASIGVVTGSAGAWNWSYSAADNFPTQTVTITASDEDGGSTNVTFDLTANNVAPTLTVDNGAVTVDEGHTAANSGTFADVPADTVTLVASIGTVTGSAGAWSWSYDAADNLPMQTVTITASDEDGGSTNVTFDLTANNVAPTLTVDTASVTVNEGQTATNSGTFGDVPADTVTLVASFGTVTGSAGAWNWSYNTTDNMPTQPVTITASDEDGGSTNVTFDLTVNNVAPTLTVDSASVTVNEGQTATNTGTFGDVPADTVTLVASIGTVAGSAGAWSWSYDATDSFPTQTVTITASDEDGGSTNVTFDLTANNVAPTLTVDNAAVTVNEGQTANNSGTFGDVPADTVTLVASFGTVTGSAGAWNWSYNTIDNMPTQAVTITASDEDGGSMTVTFDLTVNNIAPTLTVDNTAVTVNEGQTATNSGTFDDVPADTVTLVASTGTVTGSAGAWTWSYNTTDDAPTQTVTITATDEDGGSTDISFSLTVNNVAPSLALNGASDVDEGSGYTLNLSSADPGADTISQWTINWGDSTQVVAGHPASVSHTYADGDASYSISATATDEDGTYAAGNTVAVAVHNVAPTLAISGAASVNEAASYTLNLSSSDPGTDSISQWTINWGDSSEVVSGNPTSVSHTYADGNASYTISATATDEDGVYSAGNTVAVNVANVAPVLAINGTSSVNEGSSYTLGLTSSDPGADTISQWTISWGDSTQIISGNPTSVSHTYADGTANYTISATATDEDGMYAAGNTVAVTVNNVAPTLAISGASSVNEGSAYTLNLSSSDPGADTISQWTIDWGDSTQIVSGNPTSVTHTYADGTANFTISATATDEDGLYAAGNTVAVTVNNVAPTLAISGASSVNEGSAYTLNLSSSDPGADTISQWTINWGDTTQVVAGHPASVSHTYADGTVVRTISATATDEDGMYAAGNTVAVTVNNVAPTLTISGGSSVNEGSPYTLNLSSSDPGADTISQWNINWGDSTQVVSGHPASVTHTYADGTIVRTISATATDEDGVYAAGNTVAVIVNNVAPTLAISGGSSVNEGSSYTLNLSSSDPGADTISQWTINWGDTTQIVSGHPASVTHTYADGTIVRTISATATDEDGVYAAGNTLAVTVNNVAPTLAISGVSSVNEGSPYTLNLSSADPGADTISQWTITWGDGTQVVTGHPASVTHVYADGNASSHYTISATATDEDGTYAASHTVAVTVMNVAPTANAGGPYATFDDTPITLTGTGTDPAGAADPLTFKWDLDGDGIFGETGTAATRGNETGANVTYNPTGLPTSTQTVKLQVSDGDGGVTVATSTVQILGQGTLVVGGVLYIVGSNTANDIVLITECNNTISVVATFNSNNPLTFNASAITDIQVRTRGGNDIVITTSDVTETMTIDGGTGNDLLTGGGGRNVIIGGTGNDILYGAAGDDILFGGDGNDDLFGGDGNDVIVGGNGNDILSGGSGRDVLIGSQDDDCLDGGTDEDVLIGGVTTHDNDIAALDAVMAVWNSSASFSSRVATLSGSGGLLQAGVTVFDDDDHDQLVGNAGRDLYFGDNNPADHVVDSIDLQALQDQLIAVT